MENIDNIPDTSNEVPIKLTQMDLTSILISLVIGFIVIAIFVILKRKASGRRDFLLLGLCESGKSSIFMQLLHNVFADTFTSITENIGEYKSGRMSCRLIDIPGHYRVREKYFDQYKRTAKGIIFVIDAVTAQKEIRDIADTLYTILSDNVTSKCSFLVLCNKQDMTTSKSAQVIKTILEKEMSIVRDTRSRKLQSTGDEDTSKSAFLGREGKDFEFTQLQQNVQFFDCCAKEHQLTHLSDWIDRML